MTNSQAFAECLINTEHNLLGVSLKPLCLLHFLWLYQVESPLVITNKEVSLADVEVAALICSSSSSAEILSKINLGKYSLFKKVVNHFWRRRNRKANLEREVLKFIDYHNDYISLPRFRDSEDVSDEKIPWLLQTLGLIVRNTGWSLEYATTLPLGLIFNLNIAANYLETGQTNVKSDRIAALEEMFN